MGKTTSTGRMRKIRAKRAAEPDFDEEKHQLKDDSRFRDFRRKRKNKQKQMKKRLLKEENMNG